LGADVTSTRIHECRIYKCKSDLFPVVKRENETKQIQDIIVYLLAYNFLFMVFNGCSRVALLLVDAHLNFKAINKLLTA
jgi:hypothetical protein